jgi:hypothetical protein
MTDYEMRAFYQDSSSEESLAARVCAGLDPQRDNLLPKPTSCPDIYGESFLAKKFRKAFECEQVEEECDISDTVERCKGPGEAKQSLGRVSKAMRRTCFIRPSHLIVGMRKPKDAPIAVTPGVRISALLNRTEKMDRDIGKTFDKIQDDTRGMMELGNDPYLIENTEALKKDYDDLLSICDALRAAHLDVSSRAMVLEWIQKLQLTDDQLEESRKQLQRQADDLVHVRKQKQTEVGRMLSMAQSTLKNIDETIDTIQFVKMSDAERKRRVILEENQIHMEFMNLVANTLGSLPAMIDWMLLQFCSRGSLFARIMKFTPLYLACSNKTDDMHAGLLNSTGIDNPKELVAELSNAKKLIVAALANTREVAQAALDDYVANYMGPTEAAMANSQALGRN